MAYNSKSFYLFIFEQNSIISWYTRKICVVDSKFVQDKRQKTLQSKFCSFKVFTNLHNNVDVLSVNATMNYPCIYNNHLMHVDVTIIVINGKIMVLKWDMDALMINIDFCWMNW